MLEIKRKSFAVRNSAPKQEIVLTGGPTFALKNNVGTHISMQYINF